GVASIARQESAMPPPSPERRPTYSLYTDPEEHSSGEPSVGVSWNSEIADNGGTILYISGLKTLRLRLDECTSPAKPRPGENWKDVSPPNALTSLDPILYTDSSTGRTF